MAYLTIDYYLDTFGGEVADEALFNRLATAASDIIDAIATQPITDVVDKDLLAKATAYQVEYIEAQGGIAALTGCADSQRAVTEKLDDYSITEAQTSEAGSNQLSLNGIPISPMTVSILRRMGLMSRWVYAGRKRCR